MCMGVGGWVNTDYRRVEREEEEGGWVVLTQ